AGPTSDRADGAALQRAAQPVPRHGGGSGALSRIFAHHSGGSASGPYGGDGEGRDADLGRHGRGYGGDRFAMSDQGARKDAGVTLIELIFGILVMGIVTTGAMRL